MRSIGKKIGGRIYIHKSSEHLLPIEPLHNAKMAMIALLPKPLIISEQGKGCLLYDVICYHPKTGAFTFTKCEDFDKENEPVIRSQIKVDQSGSAKVITQPSDPRVYHHKWMMVSDDYKGFDVEASKERSKWWAKQLKAHYFPKNVKRKIGSLSYWNRVLKGIENAGRGLIESVDRSSNDGRDKDKQTVSVSETVRYSRPEEYDYPIIGWFKIT